MYLWYPIDEGEVVEDGDRTQIMLGDPLNLMLIILQNGKTFIKNFVFQLLLANE
ncbi:MULTISPECIES: hypothetical protein [Bacillaceae]|uniref:hypothetical protein n=1 Tax=Bacillaceae TaxID=186817 RepID=UPI00159B88D5|nr:MULTISPECIES: hypothetical protein [Bacillaceae]UGB32040.1 hypothetical protein LPC09_06095 [Metabacillus sp. B2-18]